MSFFRHSLWMLNQQAANTIQNSREAGRELVYSCTVVHDPGTFDDIEKVVIAKQLVPVLIFLPFLYIFDVRYDFILKVLVPHSNNICLATVVVNLNGVRSWDGHLSKSLDQ